MTDQSVLSADLVAAALRAPAGCPPIERLAAAVGGELSEPDRAAVVAHAASCPACAAELELARSFAAELPDATSAEGEETAWVVERLRAGPAARREPRLAPVVSIASRRPAAGGWRGWAALAATLATVGVGVALTLPQRPPVAPALSGDDVVRGGGIDVETRLGTLAEAPSRIVWRPIAGAASYRLEIVGVDDQPVVRLDSTLAAVEIPATERARLETLVRYRLFVSAFDASGARVARSEPLELTLDPARPSPR